MIRHVKYGHIWILNGSGSVFLESYNILIISDLHFGKAMHFRRNGISIPSIIEKENLVNLKRDIHAFPCEKVIFLGDLFHSTPNTVWVLLEEFFLEFPEIEFILVEGNHDKHSKHFAKAIRNFWRFPEYNLDNISFTHEPKEKIGYNNVCGHLHPSVKLVGKRGSIQLACFHFTENRFILPAFGQFTGTHPIQVKKGEEIFLLVEGEVVAK